MKLFLYECKKILLSKVNLIVLIAFTMISIYTYVMNVNENPSPYLQQNYYDNGQLMGKKEVLAEVNKVVTKWEGELTPSYFHTLKETFIQYEMRLNEKLFDKEKMDALYGEGWNMDYMQYPSRYGEGKERQLIIRDQILPHTKEDIEGSIVFDIYMNYAKPLLEEKLWDNENGVRGQMFSAGGSKVDAPVYNARITEEEILFLKDEINQIESFYYGQPKQWSSLLITLGTSGMLLLIWIILISSNNVNKERKNGMLELQRTSIAGKRKLILSKLMAVIVMAVIGWLALIGITTFYALITGGLGDANINLYHHLNAPSPFTYGQAFTIGIIITLLGAIVTSIIGTLMSTFIKSTYQSLGITFTLLFFVPMLLGIFGPFKYLMPHSFMNLNNSTLMRFTINIFNQVNYLYKMIPMLWIPIMLILIVVICIKYTSKTYKIID